jgi:hypothetical protein
VNIIRYINGKKVDVKDLPKYELENEIILKTIKAVNDRIQPKFHQGTLVKNGSRKSL